MATHNVPVMFERYRPPSAVSRPNNGQVVVTDDPPEPATGTTSTSADEDDE